MKRRDELRTEAQKASPEERKSKLVKYRKQRNKVTSMQRKDNISQNVKKMEEANNPSEVWKLENNLNKPKEDQMWKIGN